MGGVWCRADRGPSPTYSSKGPFTSTISRWTDHVRQAYRKPKTHHRPPRPPQKPLRSHDRLIISPPQLVKEQSSDGWRTATLVVPQATPIPPPRKKKRRLQELARSAYSMDDLNAPTEEINKSTISLPEKYPSEPGLEIKGSSSTLVITPILESRLHHTEETKLDGEQNENNEETIDNKKLDSIEKIDEKEEDYIDDIDFSDEIIPVEKESMFTTRTVIHSNLGYIDKLSAISEVSAESGFDDRTDPWKYSERSESVTSNDSLTRDAGLTILAHIHNINGTSHQSEPSIDVREKNAISKREWLENILREEHEPYLIPRDTQKTDSESVLLENKVVDVSGQPTSLPSDHLHLMNPGMEPSVSDNRGNKTPLSTPPSTPEPATNHSVLLGLLRANRDSAPEDTTPPYSHRGESIFLTNTKTNIIYKSLSSDNLTDEYEHEYVDGDNTEFVMENNNTEVLKDATKLMLKSERTLNSDLNKKLNDSTPYNENNCTTGLDSGSNETDNKSRVVSSFDFKNIIKSQQNETLISDSEVSDKNVPMSNNYPTIVVNGIDQENVEENKVLQKQNVVTLSVGDTDKKGSAASSRRSSLTDSLHEFELSIYDMLNESKKYRESSDEEESIKTIKCDTKHL